MRKVRKGDKVVVITGKDKGKKGEILRVLTNKERQAYRVVVSGINIIKKHVRPNPQAGEQGGIIQKEASIHISNVAILNPQTDKADRIGFKILEDGKKVRYFKSNQEHVDV